MNPVTKTTNRCFERQYRNAIDKLLTDPGICVANRDLFRGFFEHQEYKLRRINGRDSLDENSYKTLYGYIMRFRNVNKWFNNKPFMDLTREDIQSVYDQLEDGVIVNQAGKPFRDRVGYYNKVFKSKLFEMAGKKTLAKEVIQFCRPNRKEVRYVDEAGFRLIVGEAGPLLHRLLMWLNWDYGENICAVLELETTDFFRQDSGYGHDPQYRVNLREKILKRSRRPRSLINNYPETARLLDRVLPTLEPGQKIFHFEYRNAKKLLARAVERSGVVCQPNGESVTWKDLRSGMACDLLSKGWTRDQINARLGHRPSSTEIDAYINFLAIDEHRPKHAADQVVSERLRDEAERSRQAERMRAQEVDVLRKQVEVLSQMLQQQAGGTTRPPISLGTETEHLVGEDPKRSLY